MRKIISAILCFCIVLTLFSGITVSAQSVDEALYERVRIAAQEFRQTVDISDLNFGEGKQEVLSGAIEKLTNEPEFFYVSNRFSYLPNSMTLNYWYEKNEAVAMKKEFEAVANEMVADLIASDISDVYKALLIHDRLAVLCEYDYDNYKSGTENIPTDSYNIYGALVKRIAVCEGYSKAYKYLLKLVGINSEVCSSRQLRHMWNTVEIDGKWYYVDVTHDDPVDDVIGRVSHKNFLVSSEELYNSGSHGANDYDMSLNNTEYDDYYWQSSDTEFQYIGGEIYYFDNEKGELKRLSDGLVVDRIEDYWTASETSVWSGNYTRISSCDENIYYSSTNTVYIYHTKTGFHHKVLAPHLPEHLEIYGLSYEQDEIGKKFVFEYRDCPAEAKLQDGQVVFAEVSEKQFYFDIGDNKFSGLVSGDDGKWHYVVNGEPCLETGIIEIGDTRFYIVDGLRSSGVEFITDKDGKEYYVEDGVLTAKTGLLKVGADYYYIVNGIRQYDTCFLRYNGTVVYYIKNGVRQYTTGFIKYGSYYYYLKNGIRQNNTGFIKDGSKYYYVKNGIRSVLTGLQKHGNAYYYLVNGVRQYTNGFVKSGSVYYYVSNGIKSNFTGLQKYGSKYYYLKSGARQDKTTALVKHTDGKTYYVKKGIKQSYTGFLKSDKGSYYVKKGIKQTTTGFVKIGKTTYYVKKGVKQTTTGFVKSGKNTYYVKKGIRSNKTTLVKVGKKSYYIKKGIKQSKTGIVKIGSKRYYLKKGILQVKTGRYKISGKYYRLKKGIVQK